MRDRLIELLNEATFGVNAHTLADHLKKETIEAVADHLLAAGVVVPPCKVGDILYTAFSWQITAKRYLVHAITSSNSGKMFDILMRVYDEDGNDAKFSAAWMGKTVFLTKEEAEKALEERSKSDG